MAIRPTRRMLLALTVLALLTLGVASPRLLAQGEVYMLTHFVVMDPGMSWKWDDRAWRQSHQLLFYYQGKREARWPQLTFREVELDSVIDTEAGLAACWKGRLERQAGGNSDVQLVECEVVPEFVPISRLDSLDGLTVVRHSSRSHEVRRSDGKIRRVWLSRGYLVLHPRQRQFAIVSSLSWRLGPDDEPVDPEPADADALKGISYH